MYICWAVKRVTMVTMVPWVSPLPRPVWGSAPVRVGQHHRCTRPQACSSARGREKPIKASCLCRWRLSNQTDFSRQMQLIANCSLIRGIYTAVSQHLRAIWNVTRECKGSQSGAGERLNYDVGISFSTRWLEQALCHNTLHNMAVFWVVRSCSLVEF
jgi:hypothetical protein